MWTAKESSVPAGYDTHEFLWDVVSESRDTIAEGMSEQNARLIAAAPAMLAMLQRLTHPAASEDDRDDALELLRDLKEAA